MGEKIHAILASELQPQGTDHVGPAGAMMVKVGPVRFSVSHGHKCVRKE